MSMIHTSKGSIAYERRGDGPPSYCCTATRTTATTMTRSCRRWRASSRSSRSIGRAAATRRLPRRRARRPHAAWPRCCRRSSSGLGATPAMLIGNSVGGFSAARLAAHASGAGARARARRRRRLLDAQARSRLFCRVKGTERSRVSSPNASRASICAAARRRSRRCSRARGARANPVGIAIDAALWRSFAAPGARSPSRAAAIRVADAARLGPITIPCCRCATRRPHARAAPRAASSSWIPATFPSRRTPRASSQRCCRSSATLAQDAGAMRTATEREVS